ncbi:MAG: dihydrofolate reductase, partial [Anaerotignum sp.]|nr:dihydrofolate reductase [Anaerotignum sp.]
MDLIVAVDEKWGIGKDGDLLHPISADLKYFRMKTTG